MTDFRKGAETLNALRRETARARATLEAARDALARGSRGAAEKEKSARDAFFSARGRERDHLDRLGALSDPRKAIETLSDSDPILLFPVRLETRFRTHTPHALDRAAATPQHELLVRIYPDDCAIDSFEASPSDSEIKAARLYWLNIWRAGAGDEAGAKSAFRGLVGSCGAGRAAWLLRAYAPLNAADAPAKAGGEVLLVASAETAPDVATLAAMQAYWPKVWAARDDAAAMAAADQQLEAALGAAGATAARAALKPFNLTDAPPAGMTRAEAVPRFAVVVLPSATAVGAQRASWSSAPKAYVLPDRFLALAYGDHPAPGAAPDASALGANIPSPLIVGIDPNAPKGEQIDAASGGLIFGDDIAWLVDFDAAEKIGMGLRVSLTPQQAHAGFARLVVLGVRATADAQEGKALLQTLIGHHRDGRNGFALLQQGFATNNTEERPADFKLSQDAAAAYAAAFAPEGEPIADTAWTNQRDGARLAAALGLDLDTLKGVVGVNQADQIEARRMHLALFPGTLGFFMHEMMGDTVSGPAFDAIRAHFLDYVSGRGPISAVRIGAQPYGVLPTVALSRLAFGGRDNPEGGLRSPSGRAASVRNHIAQALRVAEPIWDEAARRAPTAFTRDDPDRTLLDVLGQHAGSVQFHRRQMESGEEHLNRLNIATSGGADLAAKIDAAARPYEVTSFLASLGLGSDRAPPIARRFFFSSTVRLSGPAIELAPLSETETLESATADGRNYLAWLADAARADMDLLRRQEGFAPSPPNAMLYMLLRFALQSGYRREAARFLLAANAIDETAARAMMRDPAFVHVKSDGPSESGYRALYAPAPGERIALHRRIAVGLSTDDSALREQIAAIQSLKDLPTARLERLFVEHLDCLSYRIDAWRTSLALARLEEMRAQQESAGVLIGAYGWVEALRPRTAALRPFEPAQDLAQAFDDPSAGPLMIDPDNQGFIHAPSLDHAVTAAILRNGHMSIADRDAGKELSVNLSSERVRRALDVLQGMREGQSLGALLGYQFERGLHERFAQAELDKFIQPLRNQFPLEANRIPETSEPPSGAQEAISARNVVDGRRLARVIEALPPTERRYPFGAVGLPGATDTEKDAMGEEAERLLDTLDAISDLTISESVHQAARGNFDRSAGILDAMARGTAPPDTEVTLTPRSGVSINHRVALHLQSTPAAPPLPTPRALAEPRLEAWLRARLPSLNAIVVRVTYFDRAADRVADPVRLSMTDLGLSALDLVLSASDDAKQGMGVLDDLIVAQLQATRSICPDSAATIDATTAEPGEVSLFAATPLIASLRALLAAARPLTGADLGPPAAPYPDPSPRLALTPAAVFDRIGDLSGLASTAETIAAAAKTLAADTIPAQIANVDALAAQLSAAAIKATFYGAQTSGFTLAQDGARGLFAAIRAKAADTAAQWATKSAAAAALLSRDDDLRSASAADADRLKTLREAEALVSATLALSTPPTAPDALRAEVASKKTTFDAKQAAFDALAKTAVTRIADLIAQARAVLPIDAFMQLPYSFDDEIKRITFLVEDLARGAAALAADLRAREAKARDAQTAYAAATTDISRAKVLNEGAKALLGEAFFATPGVYLSETPSDPPDPESQRTAWANAVAGAGPGGLLRHLVDDLGRIDPVDEWFTAAARVRAPMRDLERAAILGEGLGGGALALEAFQAPFAPGDGWLAAEFPSTMDLSRARILYTAALSEPWADGAPVYGLLLDEWVETLPTAEETTGLAFHFNRPNAEAPQAWLLALPPQIKGAWAWEDLVDAVNETLDMSRRRAAEPDHLRGVINRLIPATTFTQAQTQVSIVLDLALNNIATKAASP